MEIEIIKWIQSFHSPLLDVIFEMITLFGEELLILSILTTLYWAINKKIGEYVAFSFLSSALVNNAIKDLVKAPRPFEVEGIRVLRENTATGYSFPSGHTQGATSFYGAIAKSFNNLWFRITLIILVLLIGLSRLYLGVHYPKDVLGGLVFGTLCVFVTHALTRKAKNMTMVYFITFLLFTPMLLFAQSPDFIKALGSFLGFALGIWFESRYVGFTVDGTLMKKTVRVVVGLILLVVLKSGLKVIFPPLLVFDFIRYGIITFVGIGLYPLCFKTLHL